MTKAKIGKSWTQRYRTVNGKRKLCKVRKVDGKEQVRVAGYANTTDNGSRQYKTKKRRR